MTSRIAQDTENLLGRCRSCEHWKFETRDWEYDEFGFGECKAILMREHLESEAWRAAGYDEPSEEAVEIGLAALKAAKAFCIDGSSYYAAVRTAPDFGCVLWTAALANLPQDGSTP